MAERSSSASGEQYSNVFQVGNDSGKDSKSKKRRRRRQKKQKLSEQSLENVQDAESSADCSESNQNFEESAQNSGEHEGSLVQAEGKETTAELDEQDSGVLDANAPNLAVAEGTSDSRKDSPSEENLVTGKGKKLSEGEGARDANDDGAEGTGSTEDKSTEHKETGTKKRKDLLSFARSKKNKTQRAKKAAEKASGEKNRDIKDSVGAEGDSGSRTAKSKSLGKENEQEPHDREMAEHRETSAMKESDNSPEDGKTVENNEGQIGEHERARETDATGSNKAKKFKPLANFRRHKKKADAPKSASAEGNTGETAETKQLRLPEAACDDGENGDKVFNDEDEEKTESHEDAKKKSTGKKFAPLLSFRRSKATKKSAEAGSNSAGTIKEKNENSQEKDVAEEENCQDSGELDAQQSAVSEQCTGGENSELLPEEEQIQDICSAEAMTPTKKEKKKGLLRRRVKKMWPTSGKTKDASNVEMAKENVADQGPSGAQGDNSEQQSPQNPPAEANSEERDATETLATEQEESEPPDSATTAEKKTEGADEMSLEAAPIEDCSAETQATEKAEKTAGLFGRQMKKIKPLKKRKEENETKKVEEEDLMEKCSGASGADNKEITKQVKRKKSGFQKISNALKKKKSRDEGWQNKDQAENEALMEKEPQETDRQTTEDEQQRPINHDAADAEDRGKNDAQQSDPEEAEKLNASEECPSEEEELSVERQKNQGASAMEAYKAHGNLMKPVIQELLAKMAKIQVVRASAPAEPWVEPEEDSEVTKTSDDNSLTEVTSTIGDSSQSFADTCSDGKDSVQLEEKPQERNVTEDHDEKPSDDTKDAEVVEESSECVPNIPEAEREKPSPDETPIIEISPTRDADGDTVIPEKVPNATETEPNGKWATAEGVENAEEIQRGSEDSEEGDNEESEASQDGQEREIAKSEDLNKSGVTSDLDSSQTAPSKGRKEDWILVNHLEISQELSHQLKVLALDSFEGTMGCCSII